MADVTFKDNSAAVKRQMEANINAALEALGMEFTSLTQPEIRVDTGRLKNSQTHQVNQREKEAVVGNTAEYAVHVHFSGLTRNWAGDPWMTRTLNNHQKDLQTVAEAVLGRGFE